MRIWPSAATGLGDVDFSMASAAGQDGTGIWLASWQGVTTRAATSGFGGISTDAALPLWQAASVLSPGFDLSDWNVLSLFFF